MTHTCTSEEFVEMLSGLIKSGVTFKSTTISGGKVFITFTGGY